jgi:hypothetical protein
MRRLLIPLVVLCAGAVCTAQAASLADPTRPPAALFAPVAASGPAAAPRPTPAPQPLHVQSVRLPAHGAPSALIDDHLVTLGDKLGGHTVVAIDAGGVQLRDAQGRLARLALIDRVVVVRRAADAAAPVLPELLVSTAGDDTPAPVATLAGEHQR